MAKQTSPLSADELLAKVAATKDFTSQSQMADKTIDADVVDWIDTQAASLNLAIGRPGIPVGRMTLLVGKEKAGKSTCGYHLLQETQRRGGIAILIDSERRYTRDRAERIGIDHPKLIYIPGAGAAHTRNHDLFAPFMERHIRAALSNVRADRINTFYFVEHVDRFTAPRGQSPLDYVMSTHFDADLENHERLFRDFIAPLEGCRDR